jgi:hypothetical protein
LDTRLTPFTCVRLSVVLLNVVQLNVAAPISTVQPGDGDGFEEDGGQEGQSGHVGLQQVEDVHAALRRENAGQL